MSLRYKVCLGDGFVMAETQFMTNEQGERVGVITDLQPTHS